MHCFIMVFTGFLRWGFTIEMTQMRIFKTWVTVMSALGIAKCNICTEATWLFKPVF